MPDNSIPSTDTLPDDIAILQGMVMECHSTIERLKHELLLLRQWRFGRKSEKLEASGQLSLFPGVAPVEADKSDRRASGMLLLVQKLYRVEKRIKSVCRRFGWSFDSSGEDGGKAEEFRRRRREKQSLPILSAIGDWLHGPECSTALPKSPFGEAVGYCLNNWQTLSEYVRHGNLSIDNNAAERKLRPVAVGRKNYLFFGSDNRGRTAAVMYSVISSAKRHGLDPCLQTPRHDRVATA